MDVEIYCCKLCFDKIAKHSTNAAHAWLEICTKSSYTNGYAYIQEHFIPEALPALRQLEKMGYISSCDHEHCVIIRVNGYSIHEDEDDYTEHFCLEPVQHSKKRGRSPHPNN